MINNSKLNREQFLSTKFLKITLIQLQKGILHRNRFIFEIITDRRTQQSKKKYSQIKKFSEQLQAKLGMKELVLQHHLRSAQQYKSIQNLFNKLNNGGYIMIKQISNQSQQKIIHNVRNYLYNLLLSSIQNNFSSQQETQISKNSRKTQTTMLQNNGKAKILDESLQSIDKSDKKSLQQQIKQQKKQIKQEKKQIKQQKKEKERQNSHGFKNAIKNIIKSKKQSEEQKKQEMLKNIKTMYKYNNKSWILQHQQWLQRQFVIMQGYLIYYEKEAHFKKIILLKNLQISLQQKQFFYIKISHLLLKQTYKIRVDNQFNIEQDRRNHNQYLSLLFLLKETQGKVDYRIYNFVSLRISNKKNKFIFNQIQKKPTKELAIKIGYEIEPQLFCFSMLVDSTVQVLLPIYNNYGQYNVQVTQQKQGGLLANLRQNSITFPLPVQNIYDQIYNQKPKMKIPDIKNQILTAKQCNYILKLEYLQRANRISYISSNQKDRFQGLEIPNEISRDQVRIQKNRLKRILFSAEQFAQQISSLQNFEYPVRSIIFYVLLLLFIIQFDANYMLHYSLIGLLVLMAYYHPSTASYFRQIIIITKLGEFMQKFDQNIMLKNHETKYGVYFNKDLQKKRFLQKFNIRTRIKRNIIEKYQRIQKILLLGQLNMTEFVTLTQKIKNIITWYHHKKTKELFLLLLVLLAFIIIVPIKWFFLIGLYSMYIKGRGYYNRVRQLNQIILFQIIKVTIQENSFYELRAYLQDISKQFDKKLIDSPFYKHFKENLTNFIEIDFNSQIFSQAKSFKQILINLSNCKKRFIIKQEICHKYKFNIEWSTKNSTSKKLLLCLYAFIINVPSDRHILMAKSSQVQNERNDTDSQDDY